MPHPHRTRRITVLAAAVLAGSAALATAASPELNRKAPEIAVLESTLAKTGRVRVIVRLAVPQIESSLAAGRLDMARASLAAVRNRFLAEMTAGDPGRRSRWAVRSYDLLPFVVATVSAADLEALARDPRVAAVFEDHRLVPDLVESVPLIAGEAPGAALASLKGADGSGFSVAIMDSGVESKHPFFGGRVTHQACFSTPPDAGSRTLCPSEKSSVTGPGAAEQCPASSSSCSHGTHVAGIAAGFDGQSHGQGVAPKARIIAVQVFHLVVSEETCKSVGRPAPCILAQRSDQLGGFNYLIGLAPSLREPIAALNVSIGGGRSEGACNQSVLAPAVIALRQLGIATVFSAGNSRFRDATNSGSSCIEASIAVGSTTKQDEVSVFSNISPLVDVLAPGTDIASSVMGGEFKKFGGTSMAAPHVAGAFAAIRSKHPTATVDQIEAALKSTGILVKDARPADPDRNLPPGQHTLPRIRVDLALKALAGPAPAAAAPLAQPMPAAPPSAQQPPATFAPATQGPPGQAACRDGVDAANVLLKSGSGDAPACK